MTIDSERVTLNIVDLMWNERNRLLMQIIESTLLDSKFPHWGGEMLQNIKNLYQQTANQGFPLIVTPQCLCGRHPLSTEPYTEFADATMNTRSAAGYCLAAIPRSGSTLVHRILNRLLTKPVTKTHRLFKDMCPMINFQGTIFFSVRHPYDTVYSQMKYKYGGEKVPEEEIDIMFEDIPLLFSYIQILKNPILCSKLLITPANSIYFLRYEDYWNSAGHNVQDLVDQLYKYLRNSHFGNIPQIPELSSEELCKITHETSAGSASTDLAPGETGPHIGLTKGSPGEGSKFLVQETKDYIAEKYGFYFKGLWEYSL
jgi:hypothetical protein